MRTEKPYHEAQARANLFNRRMVGRSGTVYTPGSTIIVINDDKKRARLEETAARVKVPRDPLADAIDFAGLHKDVLLGLANDEAVDAWADVWSDAVVGSNLLWGAFGTLRHYAWDLSKPYLPPLLQRSLRFDPRRWVSIRQGYTNEGLRALLEWSPKSLDLNGLWDTISLMVDDEDEEDWPLPGGPSAREEEQQQLFLKLVGGAERIHYIESTRLTKSVLEVVLPVATNLKELFIRTQIFREDWLKELVEDAGLAELAENIRLAEEGLDWAFRASAFEDILIRGDLKFYGDGVIVGDERYTLSECLQKAADNPYMDFKTQICIMEWQRERLPSNSPEAAALAAGILQGLLQTNWYAETYPGEGRLGEWEFTDDGSRMWKVMENYLGDSNISVTVGGIDFNRDECVPNAAVTLRSDFREWKSLAMKLLKKGEGHATITAKHHLIRTFAAAPRTLNYLDCLCYAVFPFGHCTFSSSPMCFITPDDWLNVAMVMKRGDRIRSLVEDVEPLSAFDDSDRIRTMGKRAQPLSAFDCIKMFFKAQTGSTPSRYIVRYRWAAFLSVISIQGDFSATIATPNGPADWRLCASRALEDPFKDENKEKAYWRSIARAIPSDGVVHFDGRDYTKDDMLRRAEDMPDAHE